MNVEVEVAASPLEIPSGRCRATAKSLDEKGTTTDEKDHQTTAAAAATVEELAMPEAVSLAMAELTGAVKGPYATIWDGGVERS